jgi:hypothetical protein
MAKEDLVLDISAWLATVLEDELEKSHSLSN